MTAFAFSCEWLRNPWEVRLGGWALGDESTEEGRIKAARCGRSVGWEMSAISTMLRTLRRSVTTCQFRPGRCSSSIFDTLRREDEPQRRFPHPSRPYPFDARAQGKILSRAGSQAAQKAGGLSRGGARRVAPSGAAVRRALPRHGSSTTAPAAPWSRPVSYGGCVRLAHCEPISVISSATASPAMDRRVNSSMLQAMMQTAGLLRNAATATGIISGSSSRRMMPRSWKLAELYPRTDGSGLARSRHAARLGRRRPLEHRASTYPYSRARPR